MAATATATKPTVQHELVITRTFDAPRALVLRAWARPEHMVRWLGPENFSASHCSMDFRPGGAYRACHRAPDGKERWAHGTYREIVEPERLAFTLSWEEEGERGRENLITITFGALGEKTRMTFRQAFFETAKLRDANKEGWNESLDRLEQYLASADRITRLSSNEE
jgi:uncharacterized protein YndB with AHSA1/START domain